MQFTHTLSLHDVCDDLHPDLLAAVLELNCDRDIVIEVIDYSAGCPMKMYERNGDPGHPEEPAEWECEKDAEDLSWNLISDLVTHAGELPLHVVFKFSDEIRYTMRDAIQADIQKFMDNELPDLLAQPEDEDYVEQDADCDSILSHLGNC